MINYDYFHQYSKMINLFEKRKIFIIFHHLIYVVKKIILHLLLI